MIVPKLVIHTDVLRDHLYGSRSPSILRIAQSKFFCYTTVFQAIDLFAEATTAIEREAMQNSMATLKLLGMNAKNAWEYGRLLKANEQRRELYVMAAGLCIESRLPLLTNQGGVFKGMKNLQLVPASLIAREESAKKILNVARRKK